MSNAADAEQPPEITEQAEMVPIVDSELPLELPPPPEDEWDSSPKSTNVNASSFSFSLHGIIPVVLGVFSLLLLMLCGFFGYQYFQSVQASESKLKSLNQWIDSFQNKAESFLQAQQVSSQNKVREVLQNQQNIIETLQELQDIQGGRCRPCQNHWRYHRGHCYHETREMGPWLNCSDICVSINATFLKTERGKLMTIAKLLPVSHAWIGLSYNLENKDWKWEDGSSPSPDLNLPNPSLDLQGKCVYLEAHTVDTADCTKPSPCLCEMPA
ncbi:natural killer cells antigen CD94-like [Tupaia chinensis]|uniref:natural killer cells antigen CD94-like n=1 Tax=Tupaia chinensis TaxID=246437 RepID=UPI000FFB5D4B|nr:natural killer cells antigen CD94-like [Tupaia chinensis]